jgi:hypothetical protein
VVHKTSWKLSRTFLKKANDNHIDNDCFERESLESLWMEPLTNVSVFPAPAYSGTYPNIKQFLKTMHF